MSAEPIDSSGLAGRYAAALFELAEEAGALDEVAADLSRIEAMIGESGDFARLLTSPAVARAGQARAVDAVMARAEVGGLTRRFVNVAARNRRLSALSAMIAAFRALAARRRGETTAEVVSARPLTPGQIDAVADALRRAVGGKVAVEARTDPDVLGGLVVKVGSRMVDSSLRTRLRKLQTVLKGAA